MNFLFYKTALCIALERQNNEIVKLLLNYEKTKVNVKSILMKLFFISFFFNNIFISFQIID